MCDCEVELNHITHKCTSGNGLETIRQTLIGVNHSKVFNRWDANNNLF